VQNTRDEIRQELKRTLQKFAEAESDVDKRFIEKALRDVLAKLEPKSFVDEILAEAAFLSIGVGSAKRLEHLLKGASQEQIDFLWATFAESVKLLEVEVRKRSGLIQDWTVKEEVALPKYNKEIYIYITGREELDNIAVEVDSRSLVCAELLRIVECPECRGAGCEKCTRGKVVRKEGSG